MFLVVAETLCSDVPLQRW